jgi:hypothetical protein
VKHHVLTPKDVHIVHSASFSFLPLLKQGNFVSSSLLNLHLTLSYSWSKIQKCILNVMHSEHKHTSLLKTAGAQNLS